MSTIDRPQWNDIVLICKACRKRRNGPNKLKPKQMRATVRGHFKEKSMKARIVFSTCLGLCPKGAISMAYLGSAIAPRIVAVESLEQLDQVMPALIEPGRTEVR